MSGATAQTVGRLAPSPTGGLHLGHARSFLVAWWHARSRGGRVLLRIEDLDHTRVKPGMVEACLADLEWLGLDWDGEPLLQSTAAPHHEAAVDALLAAGKAYACTCSRKEILAALSAPHAGEGELRYPGTCRGRWSSVEEAEEATGSPAGVRFAVEPGALAWEDGLQGPQAHDVAAEVGDFLVARRDGVFAYQLAVVVDDARQGVTEVVRGTDLLASTARQALLQRALGLASPRWFHVPLVVDAAGRRLAKRDGDTGLSELRKAGVDPRAVVGWAARTAGQAADPLCDARDVLAAFDLTRIPPGPATLGRSFPGAPPRPDGS